MQKKNTSNTKKLGLFGLVTVATLGATALANAETYTVQKGDTLSAIAKKNGTTVDEIVSKNGIQDANKISIGQNLTIMKQLKRLQNLQLQQLQQKQLLNQHNQQNLHKVKILKQPIQIFLLQRQLPKKKSRNVSQAVAIQLKMGNIMDVTN